MIEQLNQNPLNQLCLEALRKLKAEAESHQLYSLQLAEWILSQDDLEALPSSARNHREGLLESVRMMYGTREPEAVQWAQRQLLNLEEEEDGDLESGMTAEAEEMQGEPEEIAAKLVERLLLNLSQQNPLLQD